MYCILLYNCTCLIINAHSLEKVMRIKEIIKRVLMYRCRNNNSSLVLGFFFYAGEQQFLPPVDNKFACHSDFSEQIK